MRSDLLNRAKARVRTLASRTGGPRPDQKALAQARRRVRKLEGDVQTLRDRVDDTRAVLRATREDLTTAREGLRATREELKQTRISLRDPWVDRPLPQHVIDVIAAVRAENLTYLAAEDLAVLARQVLETDLVGREGLVIETGAALGGSAIVMAAAKDPARPMRVYDVFGMIPEPSERDGEDVHRRYSSIAGGESEGLGGDTYYGYRDDLHAEVTASFARHGTAVEDHGVELVQGLFEDTLQVDGPVAFAHLDGDWYESTKVCLERIAPHLVAGGRIVLDDYFHYSGCRDAVDDYFADRPGYRLERRVKLHVVRLT